MYWAPRCSRQGMAGVLQYSRAAVCEISRVPLEVPAAVGRAAPSRRRASLGVVPLDYLWIAGSRAAQTRISLVSLLTTRRRRGWDGM
eukprot:7020695-Prymnesium_polylepis.1